MNSKFENPWFYRFFPCKTPLENSQIWMWKIPPQIALISWNMVSYGWKWSNLMILKLPISSPVVFKKIEIFLILLGYCVQIWTNREECREIPTRFARPNPNPMSINPRLLRSSKIITSKTKWIQSLKTLDFIGFSLVKLH